MSEITYYPLLTYSLTYLFSGVAFDLSRARYFYSFSHLSSAGRRCWRGIDSHSLSPIVGFGGACDVISLSRPSRSERDFAGFRLVDVPLRGSSVCRRRIDAVETLSRPADKSMTGKTIPPRSGKGVSNHPGGGGLPLKWTGNDKSMTEGSEPS